MNIPISIINATFLSTGYENTTAEYLLLSFLRAAYILMTGRMMGNFYILIVKNRDKIQKIRLNFNAPKENYDTRERDISDENEEEETDSELEEGEVGDSEETKESESGDAKEYFR